MASSRAVAVQEAEKNQSYQISEEKSDKWNKNEEVKNKNERISFLLNMNSRDIPTPSYREIQRDEILAVVSEIHSHAINMFCLLPL